VPIANCLLRWLHRQRIIEAIEIIKQPNRRQQFDNLTLIKVLTQFTKKLVIHFVRVARYAFSQTQRSFFFVCEIRALFEVGQVVDLVVRPAVPSCQDGV
jgi:hypothetical protein